MTRKLTPGEHVQNAMEKFRGPQKESRPQRISKPTHKTTKPSKQNFKANRGR